MKTTLFILLTIFTLNAQALDMNCQVTDKKVLEIVPFLESFRFYGIDSLQPEAGLDGSTLEVTINHDEMVIEGSNECDNMYATIFKTKHVEKIISGEFQWIKGKMEYGDAGIQQTFKDIDFKCWVIKGGQK